jgi:hypothetical protein
MKIGFKSSWSLINENWLIYFSIKAASSVVAPRARHATKPSYVPFGLY